MAKVSWIDIATVFAKQSHDFKDLKEREQPSRKGIDLGLNSREIALGAQSRESKIFAGKIFLLLILVALAERGNALNKNISGGAGLSLERVSCLRKWKQWN